ncbi:MAG: hypothetical protein IT449_01680 [Phycisphaerales bacterium]|nr:hypothetical protein [Phycisphaerales bacterium]
MEADRQTHREGVVWETLRRVAGELDRLGVAYAVVGGIALQQYGLLRSTQDVDILIDSDASLKRIHDGLVGHGYAPKTAGSRHLRDEITRVRIEFLIAGEFPGDGRPKPVQFANPRSVAWATEDGLSFVNLHTLIEMKLASAMSAPQRIKDRSDVLELIHLLQLKQDFSDRLNPYVRDEFRSLVSLPPPSEPD